MILNTTQCENGSYCKAARSCWVYVTHLDQEIVSKESAVVKIPLKPRGFERMILVIVEISVQIWQADVNEDMLHLKHDQVGEPLHLRYPDGAQHTLG